MFIFCEAASQQCIVKSAIQMWIELQTLINEFIYLFILALYTFIANYEN